MKRTIIIHFILYGTFVFVLHINQGTEPFWVYMLGGGISGLFSGWFSATLEHYQK